MMRVLVLTALLLPLVSAGSEPHAVVLLYHHVDESTPASTSVSPRVFEQHLNWLDEHGYEVWPLERLVRAFVDGAEEAPQRVVAITFDDGFESVYTQAWPMLEKRGWPFAVFVNSDAVDAGHSPYMDWRQLEELALAGVTIANHSASHGHLIARAENESRRAWKKRVAEDIERGRRRLADETGSSSRLFAYPYGEASKALEALVKKNHDHAFSQSSGAVGPHTDRYLIPRFAMAGAHAGMERFAQAVRSRALPVSGLRLRPAGDGVRTAVDSVELRLEKGGYDRSQLACYSAGGQALGVQDDGKSGVVVNMDEQGRPGRNRINCTAPATSGGGVFYWFSHQWVQDEVRD